MRDYGIGRKSQYALNMQMIKNLDSALNSPIRFQESLRCEVFYKEFSVKLLRGVIYPRSNLYKNVLNLIIKFSIDR